jgi:hypothetical protein
MQVNGPVLDLVVARCHEDLGWLRNRAAGVRPFVYNKGRPGAWPGEIPLPNHGREAHTYLHHLVAHYDRLAAVTVFAQGKPFDHAFDFHASLARLAAEGVTDPSGFEWLGHIIDTDDATGSRLYQHWSKNPEHRPLNLVATWTRVFDTRCPERFTFACGAQFAVTRDRVHQRPRAFYERALAASIAQEDAPHAFERMWNHVFGVPGFPDGLLQGRETLYRKPVRRLMEGREDRQSG